jgi:hypothetical protein
MLPARVGQIFLIGNKTAPQSLFLGLLPLYCGNLLTPEDLRAANRNLTLLCLLGIAATVEVVPNGESLFKDIRLTVRELPGCRLLLGVYETVRGLVGAE